MNITLRSLLFTSSIVSLLLFNSASGRTPEAGTRFERLADDATATALGLTDEQNAAVTRIISERDNALSANENEEAKTGIITQAESQLAAVLTEEQQTRFSALFDTPRIKFNFRFQKWSEVLPWLAGEAGLSLVMEESPEGAFNYSDRREYEPDEAIDLLNGWLMIKGFTLIRREQLLMCISLRDGIPDGTVPHVAPEDLPNRGRFEFVSVLIPLEARDASLVMKEIEPLVSEWGEAKPLPATKQLLVTDAADIVRSIQKVVLAVPPPKPAPRPAVPKPAPKPELQTYPVSHASPNAVVEALKKFVSGTILLDETASQVTINAVPAQQQLAVSIIKQLEENQGPDNRPELKSYPVQTESPDQMLQSLRLAVPSATVRYDSVARRIVVFASRQDHQKLTVAMLELENQATLSEDQLSVHPLKDIDPQVVQQLITSVLPDVRVTVDSRTSTLIAVGRLSELRAVKTLVDQLQPESASINAPVLQSYPVVPEVSEMVDTVIRSVVPDAIVTPDPANDRLLIVAQPKHHQMIKTTLAKLVQDVATEGLSLKSYSLSKQVSPETVTSMLQDLSADAAVYIDAGNQRVLVTATDRIQERVAATLEQLTAGLSEKRLQLKTYPLPDNMSAATVTTLLKQIAAEAVVTVDAAAKRVLVMATEEELGAVGQTLSQLMETQGTSQSQLRSHPLKADLDPATVSTLLKSLTPGASITVDTTGHRLLVTATARDHDSIQSAIDQITRDARGELPQLQYYPLERVDGEYAVGILSAIVPDAVIKYEHESRRLSVVGSLSDHDLLKPTLAKLEIAAPEKEVRSLKVYSVTKSQRTRFNSVLEGVSSEISGLQVLAGGEPDEMIVWAKPSHHAVVDTVLAQLDADVPTEQKPSLVVYPIHKTDAESVAEVLREIFADATIRVDARASRLLVRARPAMQQTIKSAIQQLDAEIPEGQEIKLMVYPVKGLNPAATLSLIKAEVPEVTVIRDDIAQTFIIRGRLEEHQNVARLLETLKTNEVGTLKFYPVDRTIVSSVQSVLNEVAPEVSLQQSSDGTQLFARVTSDQHNQITAALKQLAMEQPFRSDRILRFYSTAGSGSDAISVLKRLVPTADINIGSQPDQLIVEATEAEHGEIVPLIAALKEAAQDEARSLRHYDVKREQLQDAREIVKSAVPDVDFRVATDQTALLALVTAEQDQKIAAMLSQLATATEGTSRRTTRVIDITGTDPDAVRTALGPLGADDSVEITVDGDNKRVYVHAFEDRQQEIRNVITQVMADVADGVDVQVATYFFGSGNGDQGREILGALYPDATMVTDTSGRMIIVTATPDQHEQIKGVAEQLRGAVSSAGTVTPVTYQTNHLDGSFAEDILRNLFSQDRDVVVTTNDESGQMVVVARPEQHETIRHVLQEIDQEPAEKAKTLRVYRVAPLDSTTVINALEPLVSRHVRITPDRRGSEIVVSAPAADQLKIAELVEQIRSHRTDVEGMRIGTYRVSRGKADEVIDVLRPMFPDASLVTDRRDEMLIATALPEQHETIAEIVQQISGRGDAAAQAQAKTYLIREFDGLRMKQLLDRTFTSADDVRITWDDHNRQVIAVARPEQHKIIAGIISDLDPKDGPNARHLKEYPLKDLDGEAVEQTVNGTVRQIDPGVQISLDRNGEKLMVTTHERGHKMVQEVVARFKPYDRKRLRIFQLSWMSPLEAHGAIDRMITSEISDHHQRPDVHPDDNLQQLWVRGTDAQLKEIEDLLVQLGEVGLARAGSRARKNLRVIPVGDDVEGVLRKVENLWPRIRGNPLRILTPGEQPHNDAQSTSPPAETSTPGQFSVPPEDEGNEAPADSSVTEIDPVIVVPGNGQITIASEDTEALSQLESLLRTTFGRESGGAENRDFSIRQLRNTAAADLAATIRHVLDETEGIAWFGNVAVVPEQRLNALIVYGSRADRRRLEPLLEVLDAEKIDHTRAYQMKLLPLRNSRAERIVDILEGIYRVEMTAGGTRSSIGIPSGVPSEVATVLRQINAAASAPLLIIETQRETNALIIKAPRDLLDEVTQLAMELDDAALSKRSSRVTLVPLKKTSSKRVMEILSNVLN